MKPNVKVSLYIEGFEGDPTVFAEKLGIVPDEAIRKGIINSGHKVVSRFSSIEISSKLEEDQDLDKHIRSLIERLGKIDRFKRCLDQNCSIGINIVIYIDEGDTSPKCAMFITKETLAKISDLGFHMDFDIYG